MLKMITAECSASLQRLFFGSNDLCRNRLYRVIGYVLYMISEETVTRFGSTKLLLTVPFVFYGVFRYLFLIHKKGSGGDPTNMFINDVPSVLNIIVLGYFCRDTDLFCFGIIQRSWRKYKGCATVTTVT